MTTSSFESGIFDPLTNGEGTNLGRRGGASNSPGKGGGRDADAQARRDEILNAYFDSGGTVAREKLRSAMRVDPRLAVDFERTEAVLSEMNLNERPVGGPDVSQAVLARVDELCPYVEAPIRRQVSSARIAGVGAVLCGITLVVVLNQVRVATVPAASTAEAEPRAVAAPRTAVAKGREGGAGASRVPVTGLGGASEQYDDGLRFTMTASELPSAAVRANRDPEVVGGGGVGEGEYSSDLARHSRGKAASDVKEVGRYWRRVFFGYPVFLPTAGPNVDRDHAGSLPTADGKQ